MHPWWKMFLPSPLVSYFMVSYSWFHIRGFKKSQTWSRHVLFLFSVLKKNLVGEFIFHFSRLRAAKQNSLQDVLTVQLKADFYVFITIGKQCLADDSNPNHNELVLLSFGNSTGLRVSFHGIRLLCQLRLGSTERKKIPTDHKLLASFRLIHFGSLVFIC